ncbi:right-handed parallel beta-helix repeat-containing protein [Terriglobus saanensis]|uniref:Right handed beta helix domain-containing protein n=1 Tax=Terriglobus saanensis (strain ATCC BAA-1853 / DSM 23119 / SP1PR4) TaxID=401053 RepID=E8UXY4_TERSS|nr:right-handed parallel beta-helix repeat-containing protein [Terriglobus saanensis]ADV84218.1 hypothetical protein AciPR4_3464 [Terriglobus saanensis SP1PR4]
MFNFRRHFAPALLLMIASIPVSATTYYISQSTGSDTNSGLSQAAAFKTLAKANTLTSLKGGDSILLKRGDVWHEELIVPSSGTSTKSRFLIDAYGSGRVPILDGADPVTGWKLISADTYQVRRTIPSYKVFVDALYTQTVPLIREGNLTAAINEPGSFYTDADTLYVHLADGSNPSKHTIEVSGTGHQTGIVASNKSYVTVQNLAIMRTTNSGVAFVLDYANNLGTSTNQYNTLNALIIFNTGSSAAMPFGFDGGILVRANTSAGSLALRGWQITNNYIGRLDSVAGLNYNIGGIQLRGLYGALVKGNQVKTTNAMGIQERCYGLASSCGYNIIQSNTLTDNEGNISAETAYDQVLSNTITNSRGFGFQVQSYGYAANNVMMHLGISTDGKLYNGIDGNGGDHARYVNNTIIDVYGCSLTVEGAAPGVTVTGGVYNSNNLSGCAVYTTATAGPVAFSGKISWILNASVPKPFGYQMLNASDSAHRMNLAQFLVATK